MYKQKYKEGQQIHKEIADGVGVSNATVLRHMDML